MAKCMECGGKVVDGECSACGAESTQVTPELDPALFAPDMTDPGQPSIDARLGAVRRPDNVEIPINTPAAASRAAGRRASWYEMAAAVTTDPKLKLPKAKGGGAKVTLSGAHMLPDDVEGGGAVHHDSLPLLLIAAMMIRHGCLLYMSKLDGSLLSIGVLAFAVFLQLMQKPFLKPVLILCFLFEGGNSLRLASQVESLGWAMVPSMAGALAALCAIAILLISDNTIQTFMMVIGLGSVAGSVIAAQYFGLDRGAEALPGRVFQDGSGLVWRVPEGYNLFDARKGTTGYKGPTEGLRAYFEAADHHLQGGLIATELPPGTKPEKVLDTMDPPPAPPTLADDLLPDSMRANDIHVWRYPTGNTNLVMAEHLPDGRTLAIFLRGATMEPGKEKDALQTFVVGLTLPNGGKRSHPSGTPLTPLVPTGPTATPAPGAPTAPLVPAPGVVPPPAVVPPGGGAVKPPSPPSAPKEESLEKIAP